MGESSSLNILSRNTYIKSVLNERCEGNSLGGTPVDSLADIDGRVSRLKDLLDESVEMAILWELSDLETDVLKSVGWNSGNDGFLLVDHLDLGPFLRHPILSCVLCILTQVV